MDLHYNPDRDDFVSAIERLRRPAAAAASRVEALSDLRLIELLSRGQVGELRYDVSMSGRLYVFAMRSLFNRGLFTRLGRWHDVRPRRVFFRPELVGTLMGTLMGMLNTYDALRMVTSFVRAMNERFEFENNDFSARGLKSSRSMFVYVLDDMFRTSNNNTKAMYAWLCLASLVRDNARVDT